MGSIHIHFIRGANNLDEHFSTYVSISHLFSCNPSKIIIRERMPLAALVVSENKIFPPIQKRDDQFHNFSSCTFRYFVILSMHYYEYKKSIKNTTYNTLNLEPNSVFNCIYIYTHNRKMEQFPYNCFYYHTHIRLSYN